ICNPLIRRQARHRTLIQCVTRTTSGCRKTNLRDGDGRAALMACLTRPRHGTAGGRRYRPWQRYFIIACSAFFMCIMQSSIFFSAILSLAMSISLVTIAFLLESVMALAWVCILAMSASVQLIFIGAAAVVVDVCACAVATDRRTATEAKASDLIIFAHSGVGGLTGFGSPPNSNAVLAWTSRRSS